MTNSTNNPPSRVSGGSVLLASIWFGVLIGLGELGLLAYDKYVGGDLVFVPRQVVWMAPLANVAYLAVVGALMLLFTGGKPALRSIAFVFTAIGAAAWLFMFGQLLAIANVVLAAGAGIAVTRMIGAREEAFGRFVCGTAKPLAAALVLLIVGTQGWLWWGERSALSALPEVNASRPNVLLITMDTVRSKSLSVCGYERETTPQLEKLAERGVTFPRAIATAPWTLPTHAGLFTGRFHHELGDLDWWAGLDETHQTLAEELAGHGYATAAFTANLNYCSYEVGLARGFAHFDDYPNTLGQIVLASSLGRAVTNSELLRESLGWHENVNRKMAEDVVDDTLAWIDGRPEGRPFFAFANFYDAHMPYLPPAEYAEMFGSLVERTGYRYDTNLIEIHDWSKLTPEQIRCEQDQYDAAIFYLDKHLGRLFDELEERGLRDDTLIVITADHGEQFGEHSLYNHGNSLYLPNVRVPLQIALPGTVPAGVKKDDVVCLRDVPATILDLVGLADGTDIPGQSIAHHWDAEKAETAQRDTIVTECNIIEGGRRQGQAKSIVIGQYQMIIHGDNNAEIYDIDADVDQLYNLRPKPGGAELEKLLRGELNRVLGEEWDPTAEKNDEGK